MWYIENADLRLPSSYVRRVENIYFEDPVEPPDGAVWQPDVYPFAEHIARRMGVPRIVDLGCGNGAKLAGLDFDCERVGVDFADNLVAARAVSPEVHWIEQDLEGDLSALANLVDGALVVHSDVIEHLRKPERVLDFLAGALDSMFGLVISTPDRNRARGSGDLGPPANPAHVMEWTHEEFGALLRSRGLTPLLHGMTRNFSLSSTRNTQVAFIPGGRSGLRSPRRRLRIGAFVPCFNERDVIVLTVDRLLAQDINVTVIDDWSDDGTWELLGEQYGRDPRVSIVRGKPHEGASAWEHILAGIDEMAAASPYEWVLRVDADEQFEGFASDSGLRASIEVADAAGYDALDATLIDFRPTSADVDPEEVGALPSHWQFALRPGAWMIERAWRNRGTPVGLAETGGHGLTVEKRVFPFNLVLRHYPLRTPEQARRKIFREREVRWGHERESKGWHVQYEAFTEELDFLWASEALHEWSWESPIEWVVEFSTRQGLVAQDYALPPGVR